MSEGLPVDLKLLIITFIVMGKCLMALHSFDHWIWWFIIDVHPFSFPCTFLGFRV